MNKLKLWLGAGIIGMIMAGALTQQLTANVTITLLHSTGLTLSMYATSGSTPTPVTSGSSIGVIPGQTYFTATTTIPATPPAQPSQVILNSGTATFSNGDTWGIIPWYMTANGTQYVSGISLSKQPTATAPVTNTTSTSLTAR